MKYTCYGNFYELNDDTKCRDILVISDQKEITGIDLLVVMMNPGSSMPLDVNKTVNLFSQKCVLTKPDNTQSQIMKVMDESSYSTAVVVNLSDVREPKSSKFARRLKGLSFGSCGERHSIFSSERHQDLETIIDASGTCPVIFASGVNYKLRFLTAKALQSFSDERIMGEKNKNGLFYHPLPRSKKKQDEWVAKITAQLKKYTS